MNLHPCSSLTERGTCVVRVARVYSSKHVLQVSNRLCRCIVHFSECLWFICCPKIFDYFGVKKWILKLDWFIFIFPYHLAREYHLDFSLTVVSHYPRDFWFNFFHELFPSKTYRFVAWLLGLGSKGSSTPSIRNCLVKPLNTLPDSWATNCVLKLKLRVDGLAGLP